MRHASCRDRSRSCSMLRLLPLKIAAVCLLSACVTINVYFPAAAAEKAADKIIEDVWGAGGKPGATTDKSDKTSAVERERGSQMLLAAAGSVLDFIVPPAHAAGAD